MIRAVFFDFGGVIVSSPFDAFASYEQRSGLPPGFIRMVNATNPDTNAWARLERSEVDLEEFVAAFEAEASALGHQVDGRAVISCLSGELRPRMVEVVAACRHRFTTGLLTNNFVTGGHGTSGPIEAVRSVVELFDVVVESSRVGVRKPDPEFYELACRAAAVEPAEVVFLDDLGVNLKPARAMGMATIKVTDPDAAIDELAALLGGLDA